MTLGLTNLSCRFGSQRALDGVSIRVRPGDCYGLIGHNGAGKTTAMRIALGLAPADSGSVTVDGFDARREPREARARTGGLIEVPGFHGNLSGQQNLVLLGRLGGLSRREARAESERLLELVGLAHAGSKPTQAYSHGMRQRLGIAQALLGRPRYVLLDEPTNGLDPEGIAEIREVLRRLTREEGCSVLLSSHQLHEVADVCNRIGVVKQGRLVVERETSALLASGGRRHELTVDDPDRARAVLRRLGIETTGDDRGELRFDPGANEPAAVARALVEAGLALKRFGPRPASLEEIYLAAAHAEAGPAPQAAVDDVAPEGLAAERRARGWGGTWRAARYELARWLMRGRTPVLLALPAVLGVLAVWMRHREVLEHRALVEAGERYSTTQITAFEAFGIGLGAGLPLLAWILAGLASQSLAGELARGTLRNVLLRPLRRIEVAAGKALALGALGIGAYGLLAAACYAAAGHWFEFTDLAEVLPNGELFVQPGFAAADLWPYFGRALRAPVLPLLAGGALGFLAGSVARTGAGALALALGALVGLDLARTALRGAGEAWLHSAYLPSPLSDTSYLKLYRDVAQGVSNTTFEFADTALSVPLGWCALALATAALVLSRRSIP